MQLTEEDRNWIATAIRESEERTAEAIEATETKLLKAFHQWASPIDARIRTHAAAIRALDLENEALSDRVSRLEAPH